METCGLVAAGISKFCMILLCLCLKTHQGFAQTIQPLPLVLSVSNGLAISLDCVVTDALGDTLDVEWYHDGDVISFGGSLLRDRGGRYSLDSFVDSVASTTYHWRINIENLDTIDDTGMWSCQLGVQRVTTELLVVGPPVITSVTSNLVDPAINSDVRLECVAEGIPKPSVTWSRSYPESYMTVNGTRKGFVKTISNNTLRLNPLTKDQRGEYVCSVTNGNGQVQTRRTYVKLPYAPEVKATLRHIRVTENAEALLVCVSQAYPATSSESNVVWMVNGTDVGSLSGYDVDVLRDPVNFYEERYYSRLSISRTNSQHAGAYECHFTNTEGTASDTVMLALEPIIDFNFGAKSEL